MTSITTKAFKIRNVQVDWIKKVIELYPDLGEQVEKTMREQDLESFKIKEKEYKNYLKEKKKQDKENKAKKGKVAARPDPRKAYKMTAGMRARQELSHIQRKFDLLFKAVSNIDSDLTEEVSKELSQINS